MSTIGFAGVSKRFGSFTAVEPLDLDIAEGELVALLGPSGSGKSTILSMIAGLSQPSEGRIRIGGRDVTNDPPASRNIGFVPQSYALFPHLNVLGNVGFPLSVRGRKRAEIEPLVEAALSRVRLTGLASRRPHQLSGGQQQRVALARAIVFRPDILLLDEPMGALDRKLREDVQIEIKQLQRDLGITTLLVTHDQEEALSLASRVVVLDHGRVQQIGTPADVYHRPCNRFVARFVGTANIFQGQVAGEGGGFRSESGLRLPCAQALPGSRPSALMVRPEFVRLAATQEAALFGSVTEVVYVGHHVKVHVGLPAGDAVIAHLGTNLRLPAVGDSVGVTWDAESAWLLPGE